MSLRTRLGIVLLALLGTSGGLFLWLAGESTRIHGDEVTQRLHQSLAGSLVKESPLLQSGVVDADALEHVFHTLMVVNPTIEVYLLDPAGRVLRYSAPAGRVVLDRVSLEPVTQFLAPEPVIPILGDDPRHPAARKVFSAAPIDGADGREGFLYIVLQSELYASARAGGLRSALARLSAGGVIALLLFGLGTGLAIHLLVTRRLRGLSGALASYRRGDFREPPSLAEARPGSADEIDQLTTGFGEMAERIASQVRALRETDEHRRQLVANVSHDLRTPLATLEGYLDTLILKDGDLTEVERRHYLEIARKSGARLSQLVDELFELAKLEAATAPPNVETFCIEELAHDVLQKFQLRAATAQVVLGVEAEPDASFASAEIGLIERVFENLVDNALRHTPPGGRIRLSLTRNPSGDLARNPGNVHVGVEDTGQGIEPADLPHVFDRFYRAGDSRETASGEGEPGGGAGLGLAIAKRIVELHRGSLLATSEVGVGTVFSFDLPAAV
jgi:two-component system OmpR family sensor kinase